MMDRPSPWTGGTSEGCKSIARMGLVEWPRVHTSETRETRGCVRRMIAASVVPTPKNSPHRDLVDGPKGMLAMAFDNGAQGCKCWFNAMQTVCYGWLLGHNFAR